MPQIGEPRMVGRPRAPHVMMCAWFWAWAAVGAVGVLSLDVGPLAAAPAMVLWAAIARDETARPLAPGLTRALSFGLGAFDAPHGAVRGSPAGVAAATG